MPRLFPRKDQLPVAGCIERELPRLHRFHFPDDNNSLPAGCFTGAFTYLAIVAGSTNSPVL